MFELFLILWFITLTVLLCRWVKGIGVFLDRLIGCIECMTIFRRKGVPVKEDFKEEYKEYEKKPEKNFRKKY